MAPQRVPPICPLSHLRVDPRQNSPGGCRRPRQPGSTHAAAIDRHWSATGADAAEIGARSCRRPTGCFGSPDGASGGTGGRRWSSCGPRPSWAGIAIGSAGDGPDDRRLDVTVVHPSLWRFERSSVRWPPRIRCGERPPFTASCGLTVRVLFVVVVLSHHRQRILHVNTTAHPTAEWSAQQVVDAFPDDTAPRWIHRDRDRIYGAAFQRRVAGIASPKSCSRRRVLAESVCRACDRLDPPGVPRSSHRLERGASSARPHVVPSVLSPKPNAPRSRKGHRGSTTTRPAFSAQTGFGERHPGATLHHSCGTPGFGFEFFSYTLKSETHRDSFFSSGFWPTGS